MSSIARAVNKLIGRDSTPADEAMKQNSEVTSDLREKIRHLSESCAAITPRTEPVSIHPPPIQHKEVYRGRHAPLYAAQSRR